MSPAELVAPSFSLVFSEVDMLGLVYISSMFLDRPTIRLFECTECRVVLHASTGDHVRSIFYAQQMENTELLGRVKGYARAPAGVN